MLIIIHTQCKGQNSKIIYIFIMILKGTFIYYFNNLLQKFPPSFFPKVSIFHYACNNLPATSDLVHCALIIILVLLAPNKEHKTKPSVSSCVEMDEMA